jgi:hypothetical protein
MSVVRVGSSSKFADGWDLVFGGAKAGRGRKAGVATKQGRRAASKQTKRTAATKPAGVKAARKQKKSKSARKRR